jgi:microcystin-dependent protein
VCDLQNNVDTQVALGDVVMSVTSSGSWSDKWLEPNGDEISIAAYPDLYAIIGFNYGVPSTPGFFKLPDLVSAPNNQNYLRARTNTGLLLPGNINGGSVLRTLDENDLPKHIHTVTGTALSAGEHQHSWPVYDTSGSTQTGKIDGHAGNTDSQTFTTPLTGAHTHNLSGTTDDFGVDVPNEVWNTNTNVTPRYTNVYLKMRVK